MNKTGTMQTVSPTVALRTSSQEDGDGSGSGMAGMAAAGERLLVQKTALHRMSNASDFVQL